MSEKRIFTESHACACRAHCGACRDRSAAGVAWRRSLSLAFILPGGAEDFDCPHGLPWGAAGKPVAPGAARPLPAPPVDPLYEDNHAICMTCPARTLTCPVWNLLSQCNRAKALRGDPRYTCPANKLELQPPLVLRSSGVGPERSKNNGKDTR